LLRFLYGRPVWFEQMPPTSRRATPEPDRIMRLRTVLDRTGLSRSTIYRKIAEGTFPAQIKISINGAGWRESDLSLWVADPVAWRTERQV